MDEREHAARLLGSASDWLDENSAAHGVGSRQIAELCLAASLLGHHAEYADCHFDAERALFRAGSLYLHEPLSCYLALTDAYSSLCEAFNPASPPKPVKVGSPLYAFLQQVVGKAHKGAGLMIPGKGD